MSMRTRHMYTDFQKSIWKLQAAQLHCLVGAGPSLPDRGVLGGISLFRPLFLRDAQLDERNGLRVELRRRESLDTVASLFLVARLTITSAAFP